VGNVIVKTTRILLAENQGLVRSGLRALLRGRKDCDVCGEAATNEGVLQKVGLLKPDLVILGSLFPEDIGSLIRKIRDRLPAVEILVLGTGVTADFIRSALGAGARGYVLTCESNPEFLRAVKNLARGKPYVSQKATEGILTALQGTREGWMRSNLTAREREIAQYIVSAESNKQIASGLKISVRTVEAHRAKIMSKLGLHSIIELVRYAIANGFDGGGAA